MESSRLYVAEVEGLLLSHHKPLRFHLINSQLTGRPIGMTNNGFKTCFSFLPYCISLRKWPA